MFGTLTHKIALSLAICMLSFVFATDARAQAQPLTTSEYNKIDKMTEKLYIYGKVYRLRLYTETYPSITWAQAKPYLPATVFKPNAIIKTDDQVLAAVKSLQDSKQAEYSAGLQALLDLEIKKNKDIDPDDLELTLGDSFMSDSGGKYSPTLQKVANEYQALVYLYTMLHVTIKRQQPRFN